MASSTPRKFVSLAPGHDPTIPAKSIIPSADISLTKRAFFAAVVVEEGVHGITQDVQELVAALGTRITEQPVEGVERSSSAPSLAPGGSSDLHRSLTTRKRAMTEGTSLQSSALGHKRTLTETDTLQDMIREVVTTERTYVKRLQILKQDYADPLRNFSKKKEEALLDKYKAKTLFGNIDQLLPVNEAFLNDLEKMVGPSGSKLVGGLGDVCLKHFRDKRAFDCYKLYYAKREEAQAIFEDEVAKGGKAGFPAYIERIKYSSTDVRNRIGLRELLAEPIQRLPRYTMMWQNIIKEMDELHPQRAKLMEAERIASKIALCESDDPTKRAFTMHCLERTIEGFPPGLFSNGRTFIDCIDVEDIAIDAGPTSSGASTSSSGIGVLFCTLFLFDDRLIIVKRPSGTTSGRALARLDDIQKLLRTNGLNSLKKSGMTCKGVVDVSDITATDASGSEMHLYLEAAPQDQTDRWKGRPFRSYVVVLPPAPVNLDPTATQAAKKRFLENLWNVQALYRVKNGRCVALRGEEAEVENRAGKVTRATTFYNVYQRTPYLGEGRKPKVVVHVDPSRMADAIPFGIVGGPFVVIRLQPMDGALCRYNVTCQSPDEEEEEHIVRSEAVPAMLTQTIQQYGLFSFKTGAISRPTTPTASTRSRAGVFGLDVISRTLSRSALGGDVFSFGTSGSGTISGTKRSKGGMSRSSTQTMSTTLTESTNRFSYRSNSTAATSLMTTEDDSFHGKSPRKLVKRGKSPGPGSDSEPRRSTESGSRVEVREEEEVEDILNDVPQPGVVGESERDLALRLELAKRNSMSLQVGGSDTNSFMLREPPFADAIYEEEPPPSRVTPERRRGRRSTEETSRPESITPTKATPAKPLPTVPGKPNGPRRASLAPPKLTDMQTFDIDVEAALEETIAAFSPPHFPATIQEEDTPTKTFFEAHSFEAPVWEAPSWEAPVLDLTRTPTTSSTASVEPLSIKKKKSTAKPRRSPGSFRRIHAPEPVSPTPASKLTHTASMIRSPPRVQQRNGRKGKEVERIVVVARTTKEDLSSARRAVKRIKQEVEVLRDDVAKDINASRLDRSCATSPTQATRGIVRSPNTRHIVNKAAEARMEEMRLMIERRGGAPASTTVNRMSSIVVPVPTAVLDSNRLEEWTRLVENLVEEADKQIAQAIDQNEALVQDMASLAVDDDTSSDGEAERLRVELQSSKRQTDVLKQLLQDATAENEILYTTFNQQLEAMYEDVQLPEDQAWSAMMEDLKRAKQARNQLSKENFHYKQKLQIAEQKNEELLALLRAHGLEPEH